MYTPVAPCRVLDTRVAGGVYAAGETRDYYLMVASEVARQGGNPQGCGTPGVHPDAAVLTLTVTGGTEAGWLYAYPANYVGLWGETLPHASALNWNEGDTHANTTIVQTYDGPDLRITASSPVHVIADLVGYFTPPGVALRVVTRSSTANTLGPVVLTTPDCPIGTRLTGGGYDAGYWQDGANYMQNRVWMSKANTDAEGNAIGWKCGFTILGFYLDGTLTATCYAQCAQHP